MINVRLEKAKHCNGEYSAFLNFEYDEYIINFIRNIYNRYYDATTKEWEVPNERLADILAYLKNYEFHIEGICIPDADTEVEIPKDFEFKTKPFEHQIEGFKYGLAHNKWFLGDDMGLGKSKQAIDIAVAKKSLKHYKHCLIICGVNTLKYNWVNEVHAHSNESAYILGSSNTAKNISTYAKIDALRHIDEINSYFLITNIESFRDETFVKLVKDLTDNKKIGMIIFDECHKAKNPSSQQGKGILKISADTMIAMTGTPLMNKPLDLYIILKWLGYEKHSFYQFKNHYCVFGGYGGYEIIGYKNLEELQDSLKRLMLRRKKEEVLDLPEKTYVNEIVEMTPKQAQIYNEVTNAIKANIDQIKMANNPLAELIRMRQATGYTGILSSTIKESAKLDRLEELVEEATENDKKVVIFSNWTQITDVICERLKSYNPLLITGQNNSADRQLYVEYFQKDDNCKVIVGTIGAMGTGLTLTAGTIEIFVDEPWNKALKEQAVDRCYRIGQKNNITIYTLLAKDTIDERIHDLVEKKGALADAIVDGNITNNKKELLEYLLS